MNLPVQAKTNPAFLAWGTTSAKHEEKRAAAGLAEMVKTSANEEGIEPLESKEGTTERDAESEAAQ